MRTLYYKYDEFRFILNLVDGSSDDLDEPIKEIFLDRKFVDEHHLCSINSINWARILVQVRISIKMKT